MLFNGQEIGPALSYACLFVLLSHIRSHTYSSQ